MANNENNYVVRRIPLVVLSDSDTDPSEHSDNSDDNETMATNEHPSQNQEQEARQTRPFPLGGLPRQHQLASRDSGPSTPAVERGESSHGINVSDFVSRRAFDKWRSVHQQECNLVAHQAQELTDNWGELEETVIINDMGLAAVREEIQRGKKWVMAAAALTWVTMIRIAAFIYKIPPKHRGTKPKTVQTGENAGDHDPPHIETPLSTEDVIRIVADQLKTAFPNRQTGTNGSGSHHGLPHHQRSHWDPKMDREDGNKALTWWNTQVQARGREAVEAMTWEELKALLIKEYCPKNEM
ncbi:hypothetical protein E3N88_04540 [Mikania micrantha]|uniref:Uncharacterized protein n=1 Tax=Mikania micrantha TaxID=192012 RepID=A0A5N6PV89_9ASTR|nr:hypothetical protein E3N88_04540 [Mikania micrantha]